MCQIHILLKASDATAYLCFVYDKPEHANHSLDIDHGYCLDSGSYLGRFQDGHTETSQLTLSGHAADTAYRC